MLRLGRHPSRTAVAVPRRHMCLGVSQSGTICKAQYFCILARSSATNGPFGCCVLDLDLVAQRRTALDLRANK
jgi:hypothetical protein